MKRVKIFTDTAIDTISVERLLEKVYLEYMTDIEDAVVRCAAVEEQMPQLVAEFRDAVADLTQAMQRLESGEPSSPSTPNNPSNPNNPADPSLVDLFFTFHSGQVEEIRAAAGAALTAPGNTAGYLWSPEVPRTMPAENFRFVEVPEGVALHTVAWYNQLGNPVQWYELPAGMTIPEAPEPPEGYEWHPYPDVMPDHDMDIVPNPIK